jgi:hypothetical protein
MKRMLSITAASTFLVTATLYPAMAAPSSRTATTSYGGEFQSIMISIGDFGAQISVATSEMVPVEDDERSVSVEIADASGEPVVGLVHQGKAELGIYCGETENFSLANRKPVHIHMITGFSTDCMTGSNPTEGTIELTFSN